MSPPPLAIRSASLFLLLPFLLAPTTTAPSKPQAEFRGIFVATAYGFDWPSKASLTPDQLRAEIKTVVDRAKELHCNVILLQVRSFGDRLYPTARPNPDPWPKAVFAADPDPSFDPLGEWIAAAHASGLELHAWINPYRVDHLVRYPGRWDPYLPVVFSDDFKQVYLNPDDPRVRAYVKDVIKDLLSYPQAATAPANAAPGAARAAKSASVLAAATTRQPGIQTVAGPIDGVVFDHNLPEKTKESAAAGAAAAAKTLARTATAAPGNEARRPHEDLVDDVIDLIKAKPTVKFGLSPKLDDENAKDWLQLRKVDYVIPNFYADDGTPSSDTDFDDKLKKWIDKLPVSQRDKKRPIVVAALGTISIDPRKPTANPTPPAAIHRHVNKSHPPRPTEPDNDHRGQAHFSYHALRPDSQAGNELARLLTQAGGPYELPALVPACANSPAGKPSTPTATFDAAHQRASWSSTDAAADIRFWGVWFHKGGAWLPMQTLPYSKTELPIPAGADAVAVMSIDRYNRTSDIDVKP